MVGSGGRGRGRAARLLAVCAVVSACAAAPVPGADEASPPVGPGDEPASSEPIAAYYTSEQASRGQRTFTSVCAVCHGRNEFTGPIFALTWMAEPVGSLFEHVSTAMPQDDPGSLTPDEYAAVVAYLLQLNGRPAGERPLPADREALARLSW